MYSSSLLKCAKQQQQQFNNVQIQHVNSYDMGGVTVIYVLNLESGTDQFTQLSECE